MGDASVLFTPVDQLTTITPQQLPAASTQDVKRFENILLNPSMDMDQKSLNVSKADAPVLQLTDPVDNQKPVDFKQSTIDKMVEMDGSYQKMLSQFSTMPGFNQFAAERLGKVDDNVNKVRSYPEVPDAKGQDWTKSWDKALKSNQDYMAVGLEYQNMLTRWTMSSSFWMSKFNLISAAVNQVSQGFKTLFRTGG